jgi:PelA/Pel-15E family pectate lyase
VEKDNTMRRKALAARNAATNSHRNMKTLFMGALAVFIPFAVSAFAEDLQVAKNVLLYQRETGGWPKNYDRKQELTDAQRLRVLKDKAKNDSMIDNGATHTEIRLLANAFQKTRDERFKQAALRGIRYLLNGQYDNGGWPQQFPHTTGYARYITFNDNAMIGVMSLLRDIADRKGAFAFVPEEMRRQCGQAVHRGIDCILKCQMHVDGKPTVWCAQHDHVSFEPRKARSYELASLSGGESVGVVRFLMQIEDPSDEVVRAIEGAVAWFERSKLEGIKLVRVEDPTKPKGFDQVVVEDPTAPPMWARFYDIDTNQPIFCSRDGVPKRTLAEISYERRNGYSWLGYYAQGLLQNDLPQWQRRLERE